MMRKWESWKSDYSTLAVANPGTETRGY